MLHRRDFRQNLLINPHTHVGMSLEEHYGLNPTPNVKSFQKPGLCRRFSNLITHNLQVGENDGEFFIVRDTMVLSYSK